MSSSRSPTVCKRFKISASCFSSSDKRRKALAIRQSCAEFAELDSDATDAGRRPGGVVGAAGIDAAAAAGGAAAELGGGAGLGAADPRSAEARAVLGGLSR